MKNDKSIIEEIKRGLIEVHKKSKANTMRKWTQAFLEKLFDIGKKHKFIVYPDCKRMEGQWLFDLCWSKENEGDKWIKGFKGLKLICESEWKMNDEEIIYDFHKLVVCKADIKLMIVQYNSKKRFDEIKKLCEQSTDKSLYKDTSIYLFGSGNNDDKPEWVKLWNK